MPEVPDRPVSRWRAAARALFAPRGHEQRAVTSVPWNVGDPLVPTAVSQQRALSLVPVYAAVRLLADNIATLPLKAYRRVDDERVPMRTLPQLFALLDEAGRLTTWLRTCMTSLALRGNAYGWIIERDGMQFPTAVLWLNPDDMWIDDRNPALPLFYWRGRHIPTDDIVHIPWVTVAGKVKGLSPIEAYAASVNVGLSAQDYSAGWFANGGVPPGTMKNTAKVIEPGEAEVISSRLVASIRRRRPLVYGSDWDFNAIAVPPEDAQFVQTMQLTATQIAAIYGVPPEKIGGQAGGPLTYNTVELNGLDLANYSLRPWLVTLERAFSALLPLRQYVRLNANALARADLKTRYEAYQIALVNGWLTVDEVRALEELPPMSPPPAVPAPIALPVPSGQPQDQQPPARGRYPHAV